MTDEEQEEEQKKIGAQSALPKITQAGYASLHVRGGTSLLVCCVSRVTHAAYPLLHLWARRGPCLDDPERHEGAAGRWCYPVCTQLYVSVSMLTFAISSDFENKFVCGEIMSYEDLREHGSETAVKAAGKLRQQGKPYESEFAVHL